MEQALEQRTDLCFAEGRGHKVSRRVEGNIREAYLHRTDPFDGLGVMFSVNYDLSGGVMRCTDMNAIGVLMRGLGVKSDRELSGKTVQVYLNEEERPVALSKYQYDL